MCFSGSWCQPSCRQHCWGSHLLWAMSSFALFSLLWPQGFAYGTRAGDPSIPNCSLCHITSNINSPVLFKYWNNSYSHQLRVWHSFFQPLTIFNKYNLKYQYFLVRMMTGVCVVLAVRTIMYWLVTFITLHISLFYSSCHAADCADWAIFWGSGVRGEYHIKMYRGKRHEGSLPVDEKWEASTCWP